MAFQKFPQDFLDRIKESVSILDVVGEHVVLKKAGTNYVGLCPFHSERSPSFTVNESKRVYHCHGCKKGGDLFRFAQELHGLSFPEAVEELADRGKVPMPAGYAQSQNPGADAAREALRVKTQLAHKLMYFVATFFRQQLAKNLAQQAYFSRRGVDAELSRYFYVGYAPPEWDQLGKFLEHAKAPLELAAELGLIRPSTKAPTGKPGADFPYFDLFRHRAMFPILDLRGKVVGFGGRALGDADTAKYMNSPESFLYKKEKLLYGLFQAQKYIRAEDEVILVEGYFDVLAMHAAGFRNVAGICGTSLTAEHLKILRKFTSKITLLLDGDNAGIAATERAMELGLENNIVLYEATLPRTPKALDPDELMFDGKTGALMPDGVEKMHAILAASGPILDRRISQALAEAETGPEAASQAAKRIGKWLQKFTDPVGREIRLKQVEQKLGLPRHVLLPGVSGVASMGTGAIAAGPAAPVSVPGFGGGARGPQPPSYGGPQRASGFNGPAGPNRGFAPPQQRTGITPVNAGSAPPLGARPPATAAQKRLSHTERLVLTGLVYGGDARTLILERVSGALVSGVKLPSGRVLGELFDHPQLRLFAPEAATFEAWIEQLIQAAGQTSGTPEQPEALSPLISSVISETQVLEALPYKLIDLEVAISKALNRFRARISQQIRQRMLAAEASNDSELRAKLAQQYLDLQKEIKEVSITYDEA